MAEENGSASGSSDAESDPSNDAGRSAKVATTQMCPLGLRFSQRKMRNLFADGKLLSDTVDMVRPIRRTPSEVEIYGAEWKLEAPFPPIEVLRWRCKLRDETTGRPMIDPKTGEEMFDDEESWFTLDNRRLCCLQKAAVKLWPERCTCDVVAEIPKGARRMREIRKFRTLDAGKSVMVGSKVDGVPFTQWAWHAEVSKKLGGGGGGGGKGTGGKSRKGRGRGGGAGSSATAEDTDNAGYGESGGDGGAYQTSKGGKKGGGKARGKGYGYSGWGGGKGKGKKGRDQTASRAADAWVNQDPAIVAASASAAADYGDYYAEEAAESGYGYGYYDGGKAASGKGSKSRGRGGLNAYDAKGGYSDRARKGSGKKGGGRKGAAAV